MTQNYEKREDASVCAIFTQGWVCSHSNQCHSLRKLWFAGESGRVWNISPLITAITFHVNCLVLKIYFQDPSICVVFSPNPDFYQNNGRYSPRKFWFITKFGFSYQHHVWDITARLMLLHLRCQFWLFIKLYIAQRQIGSAWVFFLHNECFSHINLICQKVWLQFQYVIVCRPSHN